MTPALAHRARDGRRAAALGLVFALWPAVAGGHAALVRAAPGQRATLSHAPPRVELTFSERLEPAYSRVSVLDGTGLQVDLKDVAVPRDDGTRLTVSLPVLRPGIYTVRYRVLSVDGHVVESQFPFTIRAPGGP